MLKKVALIFDIQARGAFTRPWMRLDCLLLAAGVSQSVMRDRLSGPSFSTHFVEHVLGIITPDALTYEPGKRNASCGVWSCSLFHVNCEMEKAQKTQGTGKGAFSRTPFSAQKMVKEAS